MSREEALHFLSSEDSNGTLEAGSWRQIGIAAVIGDELVGDIGIHLSADQRTAEFGLTVHPDRQCQGFGTEAARALISLLFRHTCVDQVVAATDARNIACLRLLAKAGMRHTSTRSAMYKGEQCTEMVWSARIT